MSNRRNNTAKLLTLAVTLTLLGGLPLIAQDAPSSEVPGGSQPNNHDPRLESSEPILGKQVTLAAMNFTYGGYAWFFFSLTPDRYVPIDANRSIYVDLDSYVAVGSYRVEQDNFLVVPMELPEIPQLRGIEVNVQAICLPPNSGLEVTNGLTWTLMY